ncbi:MAG TPA: alginate export family protein [Planctomycetota bacterium]|nr:alginate export family protein [Planctomycetota bacterium]
MHRRGYGPAVLLAAVALASAGSSSAFAKAPAAEQDQQKLLEDERRREMNARPKPDEDMKQPWLWDAGGWMHLELDQLDDEPLRDTRTYRYADLRLWGEVRYDRTYSLYCRIRTAYTDFNSGDQFSGTEDNVFQSPHFDEVYADADWTDSSGRGLSARAGRAFVSMGSGLLYNDLAYMLQGTYSQDRWAVRAWLGHSIIHEADIDQSIEHANKSYRGYIGVEGEVLITGNHRVYGMLLVERDFNRDQFSSVDWTYNANYFGVGARGTAWAGLGYSAELVYEFGESAAATSTQMESISAFAALLTLDYQIPGAMEPTLLLQYLYGSGDPDRQSTTDALAGNQAGTDDHGFLSFGFVQTGYSLFPRVSNIHILRIGGTLRPLESVDWLHKLQVGVFGYLYRKAQSESPISDSRAFLDDADVGKEVDLTLRWRIYSDLGFSLNYGCFFPGDAYLETKARNFLSLGMTYSF